MPNYHNTPEGPKPCKASKKPCKYAQAGQAHFSSREEAEAAYSSEQEMLRSHSKSKEQAPAFNAKDPKSYQAVAAAGTVHEFPAGDYYIVAGGGALSDAVESQGFQAEDDRDYFGFGEDSEEYEELSEYSEGLETYAGEITEEFEARLRTVSPELAHETTPYWSSHRYMVPVDEYARLSEEAIDEDGELNVVFEQLSNNYPVYKFEKPFSVIELSTTPGDPAEGNGKAFKALAQEGKFTLAQDNPGREHPLSEAGLIIAEEGKDPFLVG